MIDGFTQKSWQAAFLVELFPTETCYASMSLPHHHRVVRCLMFSLCAAVVALYAGCDTGASVDSKVSEPFATDAEVFAYVTQTDPFLGYTLFPHVDSVFSSTIHGQVRVSLNATAVSSLEAGRFPASGSFKDNSVILKEIRDGTGTTIILSVMVKQQGHSLAGNGWLWAEYRLDGTPAYSVMNKGAGCTACHSLDQGLQHDYVRTFERQVP